MSCDELDLYLTDGLAPAERDAFDRHAANCPVCQAAIEQSRRIDEWVRAAVERTLPVAGELALRIRGDIRSIKRRRWLSLAAGLAAAVLCVVGWGIATLWNQNGPSHEPPTAASDDHGANGYVPTPVAAAPVEVDFLDDAIGLPLKSDNKNVTLLWVYPTVTRESEQ